jgi:hypothetical protein
VSAQLAASDLSNGVSGTGAVVLASGASLTPAKSVASNSGGGTNAGLQVVAASPAFALEASGQAADQKWWDFLVAGTSLFCRSINDANSSAFNWLTVNRGSGTTISNAVFACPVSATGFQISGAAASGNVLRGNGTNFVSAQLASADLSDTSSLVTLTGTQTLTNKTVGSGGLAGLTPSKQIFTTSGTFTIPTGVKAVKVTVLGGGGAGGGSSSGSNNGGGGAAGGCGIKWLSGLTPGNTLTVTVGSGGTGVSNATGNSGGSSSVASGTQTITTITTNGGTGGFGGGVTSAGAFETAAGTGGDINMGGSGGGFSTTAGPYGGAGGNSMFGVGGGNSNGAGRAAIGFGAGGSGSNSSLTGAGGAGAPGIVIFEWMI